MGKDIEGMAEISNSFGECQGVVGKTCGCYVVVHTVDVRIGFSRKGDSIQTLPPIAHEVRMPLPQVRFHLLR